MMNLLKMAFRDLGRNRRRSFFSALALGLGLALLLLMAGVIQWEMRSSMDKTIGAAKRPSAGARQFLQ